MDTEILLDHEPVADGGYLVRALLRVSGQAPEAEDRPRLNLGVVLDRSGSMQAMGKLDRAKEAASLLVRRLGDEDVTSVVAYDDDVRTVAGRTTGAQRQEPTDGLANVGITEPGQLRDLIGSAAAKGVSTTTIGFGADYDEQLLRSLAEAGGGSTYYIEEPDQAPAVFEAEIEGLMALAAQNVTVTVAPAATVEHATVLHQYPRQQTDDDSLRLELGDLYALEPRSLLCEFLITSDVDAAEVDVATLTIEGYVLLPSGGVEKKTVKLPIRVQRSGAAVVDPEVRRELLLLEAARAREEALEDRGRGAFEDGARKLRQVAEKMAPHADSDDEVRDEVEDLRDLAEKFDEQQVTAKDAKWMSQRAYSSGQSKRSTMERLAGDRAAERKKRKGDRT